jgi:putative Mg2+ transporter-C (MgtC) family protein
MFLAITFHDVDELLMYWGNDLPWKVALVRLGLAAVLGGLVGLEREVRGRQAGFRTNILVAMGCALAMLVSISFSFHTWPHSDNFHISVDPARVAYGVMGGIGFLGAGVIVKHEGSVRGLTTAAAMWCVAAIGLACGMGLYTLAGAAAVLVIVALWTLDHVENWLPKQRYRALTIRTRWHAGVVPETISAVKAGKHLHVQETSFERPREDLSQVDIRMVVSFVSKRRYFEFERRAEELLGCQLLSSTDA